MANRYWVNGGVNDLWGTIGNWSDTSGGAGGFSVPVVTDDVFFDANSPLTCTTNGSRFAQSINFTGWTGGTLTFSTNNTITIGSGGVVFIAAMTLSMSGSNTFICITSGGTYTSNGLAVHRIQFGGSGATQTLTDTWTVTDLLTIGHGSAGTNTINGGALTCQGSLLHSAASGVSTGTTAITMTGTGTLTGATGTGQIRNPLTINTAGTITVGTYLPIGGTFTHVAGTVVTTGSTFILQGAAATVDVAGITWDQVLITGTSVTHVLTSNINCTGLLTFGSTTTNPTINGSAINASGGVRYAGTTGLISGTTVINCNGTQSIDCPNRTTGLFTNPINLNAPNGTITVAAEFPVLMSGLSIQPGTVVVTAADTRMKICEAIAG